MNVLDGSERRNVRLTFFREHRNDRALSSVAVRKDVSTGDWFIDVGVTGQPVALPHEYQGLEVRVTQVPRAIHAVGHAA